MRVSLLWFALIIVLLFVLNATAQFGWALQTSGMSKYLNAVALPDRDNGTIVGWQA